MNGHERNTRMPIPGAAGFAVHHALYQLALRASEGEVLVRKTRAAGGGYVYVIHATQPPAEPVTKAGASS